METSEVHKRRPTLRDHPAVTFPTPAGKPHEVLAVCGLLVLAVALVFGQTARFDFVNWDDDHYVYQNPDIQQGLSAAGIRWAWTHSLVGNWHPLTTMSLMLDWQLFGMKAGAYHVHNVLLHAGSVVLLFLLLRRMTGALWPSAIAAAVFAIHPLRAESVAWVTERKDVLSGLFFLLTLWAYVVYLGRPSWIRYGAVLVLFAMGLMSKAMLVTVPVVMLLLDYWPLGRWRKPAVDPEEPDTRAWERFSRRSAWLVAEKLPLFFLAAVFSAITAYLSFATDRYVDVLPLCTRLAWAPVSCVIYVGQMFWPCNLSPHYPCSEEGPPTWQVVGAGLTLAAILAGVVWTRRKQPYLFVGWLWYLVTLLPVIGLLPGGNQMRADRYTYLTQIGLGLAAVWRAADWSASGPRVQRVLAVASLMLIVGLIVGAWRQTCCWRDSETLWRHALACHEENSVAHEHLGMEMSRQSQAARANKDEQESRQRAADAKLHYARAVEINPRSVLALGNLGVLLADEGKLDEAEALFRRAVEVTPTFADVHCNLGSVLWQHGRLDEAVASYERALELSPCPATVHDALGRIHSKQGKTEAALDHYRQAIQADQGFASARSNLGFLLTELGRYDEAIEQFRRAVEIEPKHVLAHYNWGNCLVQMQRPLEAVEHYEKAVEADPEFPSPHVNIIGPLLHLGRTAEAIEHSRQIARLLPEDPAVLRQTAWLMAIHTPAEGGDPEQAVKLAEKACAMTARRDAGCVDVLGAAYASAGRFDEAVSTAKEARRLAEAAGQKPLAAQIHMRLQLYRDHKPYREPPVVPSQRKP